MIKTHVFCGGFFVTPNFFHLLVSSLVGEGLIFFVELVEVFVEGLVHVSSLADDYYIYIEQDHKWRGQRKNKVYKIGDLVKVRVAQVNISLRRIDLTLL